MKENLICKKNSVDSKIKYETPVDFLDYRGYHVDFYNYNGGKDICCEWENNLINFGIYNTQYKEDMKLLIDEKEDTIYNFNNKAKLKFFQNGAFSDIELIYKKRILYVYLLKNKNINKQQIDYIIKDAENKLNALKIKEEDLIEY